MTAKWDSLKNAGLGFGDTFTLHGDTKAEYSPVGVEVTIVRSEDGGVNLIDSAGVKVNQCTSLGRAKWWIG